MTHCPLTVSKAISVLMVAVVTCADAQAIGPNQWMIVGLGNDSCGSYTIALAEDPSISAVNRNGKIYFTMANAYAQWLNGFVTAINLTGKPGPGQITVDVNGIALWARNFCAANPAEPLNAAAGAFIRAYRPTTKN